MVLSRGDSAVGRVRYREAWMEVLCFCEVGGRIGARPTAMTWLLFFFFFWRGARVGETGDRET
jgi:hypothetical protein